MSSRVAQLDGAMAISARRVAGGSWATQGTGVGEAVDVKGRPIRHGANSQGHRLEDDPCPPDATVHQHGQSTTDGIDDGGQHLGGGGQGVRCVRRGFETIRPPTPQTEPPRASSHP